MVLENLRTDVSRAALQCYRANLIQGTSGNLSARDPETGYVAITPTGVPYETLTPADIVVVDVDGEIIDGHLKPSSETPMHTAVYRSRPWVRGIVHTHSLFATTFACLGRPIPPVHYLIAFAGRMIPVAEYATYGTPEMGTNVLEALGDGKAVLLKHHGVLTVGRSLAEAVSLASIVEYVAQVTYQAALLGPLHPLPDSELKRLTEKFAGYGQSR